MEEKKYPKVVKLDNGMYTFENPDGTRWKKEYFYADAFREGFAVVQTAKESRTFHYPVYTFVDENGNEWEKEFNYISGFYKNGLARVSISDDTGDFTTYVDKNQNLWKERFISVPSEVSPGLMVTLDQRHSLVFYDFDHNFYTKAQADILGIIYEESPEEFLYLQTDDFENKGFIKLACEAVKGYLVKPVEGKEEVDDDYANYAKDLLKACKKKKKKERTAIAQKSDKKAKLRESIENFDFGL